MLRKNKHRHWLKIVVILMFAILLTSFRLSWIKNFNNDEQQYVTNGQLDLRGWDFSDGKSITLEGEWNFYPDQLLREVSDTSDQTSPLIHVPGDWSDALNPDDSSPYGYGSYQMRILVDPNQDVAFSMRIPSVRSASKLYANGLLVGHSGEVGESEESSKALNLPYSSTSIRADESGVIDIILQATNFVDPRSSGAVRAVKFGYEADLTAEIQLSTLLQVITGVIFFVHALFAGLIFLVGFRDKRLLYFSLTVLVLSFINLAGGDEKVLSQYLQLNYTTSYKFSMFTMILLSWALVNCVGPQIREFSKRLLPIYTSLFVISIMLIILLPMEYLSSASSFTFGAVFIGAMITILALIRSKKSFQGGIWIALAIVAISSNYFWWAYTMTTGIKVVYYPFDLIISIICLAGVWFKHYNQMHIHTKDQAIKLQEADKMKDEFLANTSHELRNPLHSILNMSQAILERERTSLQSESVRNLETVLSVSRRMSLMLDELQEMNRLEEGNHQLQLQSISVQSIIEGVTDMLRYTLKGKSVCIINDVPTHFPSVMADENRLTQIVFNLLHNAVKYTKQGEVIIQGSIQDQMAYISIKDTGIGIDQETIQTIFEPYIQGENGALMKEGGFGLGLNISKKLVELHKGTLNVQSILGEGTTLTFSIPLTDSQIVHDEIAAAQADSGLSTKQLRDTNLLNESKGKGSPKDCPRIIVVDDDPVNLQVIETILSVEQYDITTVLTAEETVSLLDKQEWDLVISDVMMPQISGYELTRVIRERFTRSELPILLLTARNSPEDIEAGFLSGANDYITKPIDSAELRSRVNVLTEVKRSIRERLRMESAWLQAQIQPHFLFNTLNSIFALSEINIDEMKKLIGAFSKVLRGKFDFQNLDGFVQIESELDLIRSYLYIEQVRFGDRLQVTWKVNRDIQVMIPALTIQPLIENAVNHGILKQSEGGEVTICVKSYDTYVEVTVEDNGVGIKETVLQQILENKPASESGVGLLNINLRLQRLFGQGLQITSTYGVGTIISFKVPYP